jgi:tetratricopeptide (TPR) repeat protein
LDPNDGDLYFTLAYELYMNDRPEEAIGVMQKGLRLSPRASAQYTLQLGTAYYCAGRFPEAIATEQQVLLEEPTSYGATLILASSYYSAWAWQLNADPNTLERAWVTAQKALALNDAHPLSHNLLSTLYLAKGQLEQARAEAERTVALDPLNCLGYLARAAVLMAAGKPYAIGPTAI